MTAGRERPGWRRCPCLPVFLLFAWLISVFVRQALAREPPNAREALAGAALSSCGQGGGEVDIVLVGDTARASLVGSICDWFRDGPWRVHVSSASAPPSSVAPRLRVVATLESNERARLVLDTAEGKRWVRDVALDAGLDRTGIEVVAQALHSTVQAAATPPPARPEAHPDAPAIEAAPSASCPKSVPGSPRPRCAGEGRLEPGQMGTSAFGTSSTFGETRRGLRVSPTSASWRSTAGRVVQTSQRAASAPEDRPPQPPRSPSPAPSSLAPSRGSANLQRGRDGHLPMRTGIGYQAYWRGAEPLAHGPALRLALDWPWRDELHVGGFSSFALFASSRKQVDGLEVDSSMASLAAGLHARWSDGRLSGRAALGGGVDLIALEVRLLDSDTLRLLPDGRARPRPFVLGEAGGAWRAGPVELALTALIRWQLRATRYQIRDDQGFVALFRPWRLQPGLALEAAYVW